MRGVTQRCSTLTGRRIVHLSDMSAERKFTRGEVLRQSLLFCACFLGSLLTTGCKDRSKEVPGVWDWGGYTVHFDTDDTWGASDKKHPGYERLGGTWSISGDDVSLGFSGTPPPGTGTSVFTLSEDGKHMEAVSGNTGTMIKRKALPN